MAAGRRPQYTECKTYGHAWDEFNPLVDFWGGLRGWAGRICLRCTRCHTLRVDWTDYLGELADRKYYWPLDYKNKKDEKPTRAQLRLIIVTKRK